jgi:putative membrane protein
MKSLFLTTAVLTVLASVAIAAPADQPGNKKPAPGSNSETMSATEDSTAGAVGTISAEMTHSTKGFAAAAATSDMYEVTAGKIALQRSQNADVKEFAQKMVDAHTATTDKLKGLLPAGVTPPAHVDDRRQSMLNNLRGASAADFDHRYAVQQVAAHKEADILMRGYANDGEDKSIKSFARDTDKDVKMHLSMAEGLASKYKAK